MEKKFNLLILDDEFPIHNTFKTATKRTKYYSDIHLIHAYNSEEAIHYFKQYVIHIAFIDYNLPHSDGIHFLKIQRQAYPQTAFIMISGYQSIETAINAMKLGAKDFLIKPLDYPHLTYQIEQLYQNYQDKPCQTHIQHPGLSSLIGKSKKMIHLFQQIRQVAVSDAAVLIFGESGTGKELIAKAIHQCSPRNKNKFVAINCSAIPKDLLESHLFGHEKGAFTGAISRHRGCFEQANQGTLFLDEIGDLELNLQVKLLRVVQEKEITLLGSSKKIKVDVRIISATHQNLRQRMKQNLFRDDLYFRLSVLPIYAPALREKKEDIPILVNHFLNMYYLKYKKDKKTLSTSAMNQLIHYPWKGNVRELMNLLERLYLTSDIPHIDYIPEEMLEFANATYTKPKQSTDTSAQHHSAYPFKTMEQMEKENIENALQYFQFNILKTAKAINIGRDTLYRKMQRYNIKKQSSQKEKTSQ